MVRVLPRMPLDPPARYVAFVEQHLLALRHESARVVGAGCPADELYPGVLTELAARWLWLDLLTEHLHRGRAPEAFLWRAFSRHARRWQRSQVWDVDLDIWVVPGPNPHDAPAPIGEHGVPDPVGSPPSRIGGEWQHPVRPRRSSGATRLAPFVVPSGEHLASALAEATIAWLSARSALTRAWYTGLAALFALILLGLLYAQQQY